MNTLLQRGSDQFSFKRHGNSLTESRLSKLGTVVLMLIPERPIPGAKEHLYMTKFPQIFPPSMNFRTRLYLCAISYWNHWIIIDYYIIF